MNALRPGKSGRVSSFRAAASRRPASRRIPGIAASSAQLVRRDDDIFVLRRRSTRYATRVGVFHHEVARENPRAASEAHDNRAHERSSPGQPNTAGPSAIRSPPPRVPRDPGRRRDAPRETVDGGGVSHTAHHAQRSSSSAAIQNTRPSDASPLLRVCLAGALPRPSVLSQRSPARARRPGRLMSEALRRVECSEVRLPSAVKRSNRPRPH